MKLSKSDRKSSSEDESDRKSKSKRRVPRRRLVFKNDAGHTQENKATSKTALGITKGKFSRLQFRN